VKIHLYYVGKSRDAHANAMAQEYIKRSVRFAKCEMREIHPERSDWLNKNAWWNKHAAAHKFCSIPPAAPMIRQVLSRW